MKKFMYSTIIISILTCCGAINIKGKGLPPSHQAWTVLVKKHVNEQGLVDYKGFINDKNALQQYLDTLSANPPAEGWSQNEKIAYWINAYNAFTVKLIIDYYPLKSIKDIGPKAQIPFINTPWDKKFFEIGGKSMTLNRIEHRILRKEFDEPRIHFALNCASMSCPVLRREAFTANQLNQQLNEQAREFLLDKSRNIIDPANPKLSKIFDWYGGDFKKDGRTLIQSINQFIPSKINENARVDYLDYDWTLNEQR